VEAVRLLPLPLLLFALSFSSTTIAPEQQRRRRLRGG
jgi:hypothetical protein